MAMVGRGAIPSSLLVLVACSGDTSPRGTVVRDSAGVRLVSLPSPSTIDARFALSEEPVYRVGWSEDDRQFENVTAGGLWSDGRAVVGDEGGTLEIIFLSPTGSVDGIAGGPGQGPGELQSIFSLLPLAGDTVAVQDPENARLTFFDRAGALGTIRLRTAGPPRLLGTSEEDDLLLGPPLYATRGRRYETRWLGVPLMKLDPRTGAADTLAWADWDQSLNAGGENPFMSGGFAAVADDRYVVGRGDRPEIRWLNEQGSVHQIVRWKEPPRAVPDDMVAAWEREMRAAFERLGGLSQADIEARVSSMKKAIDEPLPFFGLPGSMPEHGGLLGDPGGNVWIAGYRPPLVKSTNRYYALSPQGEWLGRVEMPDGFRVLAIGVGHVLGVEQDALGRQAVALYRLGERGPA